MTIFTYPTGFGKHDNLHMISKIGDSRNPFLIVKLQCFPNTEKAYIVGVSRIKFKNLQYLDSNKIIGLIKSDILDRFDHVLVSTEFPKKNLKTSELIELYDL